MKPSLIRTAAIGGAAALALIEARPASAQMAVYDAASYAQILKTAQAEVTQLQQLQQQLTQAQALFSSLNHLSTVGGIAPGLLSVPQTLLTSVTGLSNVASGNFSALGAAAGRAQQIRTSSQIYTPPSSPSAVQTFYDQALLASGNRAAAGQAVGEAAYAMADQRASGLAALRDAISTAADAKAVADITARILAESALIANDQMRLQALQMTEAAQSAVATQSGAEEVAETAQTRAALLQSMHP